MDPMTDPLWLAGLAFAMAATGLASGLLAGLLGVGGGIVIVPVLSSVFPLRGGLGNSDSPIGGFSA